MRSARLTSPAVTRSYCRSPRQSLAPIRSASHACGDRETEGREATRVVARGGAPYAFCRDAAKLAFASGSTMS